MTGDKFRARADRYIKAARVATDPVHKLALVDIAQRWLRLAAQLDRTAIHVSRNSEAATTQGRSTLALPCIFGDGAPIARK
jgi:transcription elongation factor Elf1